MPLQEVPEDWDINPATEDLPLDQVLAGAAAVRREHLAGRAVQSSPSHCMQRLLLTGTSLKCCMLATSCSPASPFTDVALAMF